MFCPKCRAENPNTNNFCKACGKPLPNFAEVVAQTQQFHQVQTGLIGQVLDGKYRIDAKLGSGGMGEVYRATRLLMGDVVAIKTLHPHLARDPQSSERFRREAITATKLRHKNIVTIYDVGISAVYQFPYILMELAEGYTLRQIINENKTLPLDFAVSVVAQVCAALTEAHQLGIIHRDIKPENVIANQTDRGWQMKVLDFGIAKLYNQPGADLTQDGSALGTPQYMSPEQCLGESLDVRSDIYSIGITIFEMLCGKPPFSSLPATAISVHQVQTPPTSPTQINPNIHPEIEKVILKALSKQRESRQQTAADLSREFIQAATLAFKAGAKPEPIEETSVSPTSENIVQEDEGKSAIDDSSKAGLPENVENSEDETMEKLEKASDEGEIPVDSFEAGLLKNEAVVDSAEIKPDAEEIKKPAASESISEMEDKEISDLEDKKEEEDLKEIFENPEQTSAAIPIASPPIEAEIKTEESADDKDFDKPIRMPDEPLP